MKITTAILVCSLVSITPLLVIGTPVTITEWTFETSPPTTAGPISPEIGSGSASAVGLAAISSPAGNGSAHSYSGTGWNPGDYFQFQLSTAGYQNIGLRWDQGSSATGPGTFGLFWSLTGVSGSFLQVGGPGNNYAVRAYASPNPAWSTTTIHSQYSFSWDLSAITDLNNATAYFRLTDMASTNPTNGNVTASGTDRIDNFKVSGDKITTSIPDSIPSLAGLAGAVGLLAVMRRLSTAASPWPLRHDLRIGGGSRPAS